MLLWDHLLAAVMYTSMNRRSRSSISPLDGDLLSSWGTLRLIFQVFLNIIYWTPKKKMVTLKQLTVVMTLRSWGLMPGQCLTGQNTTSAVVFFINIFRNTQRSKPQNIKLPLPSVYSAGSVTAVRCCVDVIAELIRHPRSCSSVPAVLFCRLSPFVCVPHLRSVVNAGPV